MVLTFEICSRAPAVCDGLALSSAREETHCVVTAGFGPKQITLSLDSSVTSRAVEPGSVATSVVRPHERHTYFEREICIHLSFASQLLSFLHINTKSIVLDLEPNLSF